MVRTTFWTPFVLLVLTRCTTAERADKVYGNPTAYPGGGYAGMIKRYHPTTFQASSDDPPPQQQMMGQQQQPYGVNGQHVGEVQDVNAGGTASFDNSYMPQQPVAPAQDQGQSSVDNHNYQMPSDHPGPPGYPPPDYLLPQDDHHSEHPPEPPSGYPPPQEDHQQSPEHNHEFHGYPTQVDHSHHHDHEGPLSGYLPPQEDHGDHPPPPPDHNHEFHGYAPSVDHNHHHEEPSPAYLPPEHHHPPLGYLPPQEDHHHHHPPPGYLPPPNRPLPYPYYAYGPPLPKPNPPLPPPPMPPVMPMQDTSGATEAPKQQPPFTYYYLGRHLWYIPLYFSIYFIVYVGALVLKAIARHKILFPAALHEAAAATRSFDHQEADRVLSGIHNMTRRYYM